jgi:hypothetical protein
VTSKARGRCRICGEIGPLTRDHVPPRCVTPPSELEVRYLLEASGGDRERTRSAFQSVEYRSLCGSCNGARLGALYDPALAEFCSSLSAWVRSGHELGLELPSIAHFVARPGAIARSIVGHLLAAEPKDRKNLDLNQAEKPAAMRRYFLGEADEPPGGLELYFWPYPLRTQVTILGTGVVRLAGQGVGPIVGDFLKFFPLAWWLTWKRPEGPRVDLCSMPLLGDSQTKRDVLVRLRPSPDPTWPERPLDDTVLLFSQERTSVTTPRRRLK